MDNDTRWLIAQEIPYLRRFARALVHHPERADDLVQGGNRRPKKARLLPLEQGWQQVAMAAGVGAVALLTGWSIGAGSSAQQQPEKAFAALSATPAAAPLPAESGSLKLTSLAEAQSANKPLNWLTQKVALEIQAPDLSAMGYSLTDRRLVSVDGKEAVLLAYKNTQGKEMKLFIKSRWQEAAPVVHYQQNGGAATAFWEDGTLTYALSGDPLTEATSTQLAEKIRQSMGNTATQPLVDYSKPYDPNHNLAVDVVVTPPHQQPVTTVPTTSAPPFIHNNSSPLPTDKGM